MDFTGLTGLRNLLTTLRECGVRRVTGLNLANGTVEDVEFEPGATLTPVTEGGMLGKDGKPVDFDEGLPELAQDPIHRANFPGKA